MDYTFFDKSLGKWESHRTYMYLTSNKIESLVTQFKWTKKENSLNDYKVEWASIKGEGSMAISVNEDKILRNIGYFSKEPTISYIQFLSNDKLSTYTAYNNMIFEEEIEFVSNDHRIRRTLGYKQNKDRTKSNLFLSGSYQEKRI